ncbi:MAG TPA: nitrilase-related carbon-nitrogen hydrolase, partial [Pyrinomonadaceae bacterium]|nr:nitrilase-related carbon-nitrogen hydrolase [Pyrinomonadaceae bacterium]
EIARAFAQQNADVLVNISNDGYLGRTPVMRQHLANVVLRAVENGRTVLRVTNTGISARVTPSGRVLDATEGFTPAARTWTIARAPAGQTFYTRYGDIFVWLCAAASALALLTTFEFRRERGK